MTVLGDDLFPTTAWRFLLPDPDPKSIIHLGRPVDGVKPLQRQRFSSNDTADLVMTSSADPGTLKRAFASCRPGGACFVEVEPSTRVFDPEGLRRALIDAGFASVRLYSVSEAPDRQQPSWWVPLDSKPAQRHLLSSQGQRRGRSGMARVVDRVTELVSNRFPGLLIRAPWLLLPRWRWRVCATAVRPSLTTPASDSMAPGVVARTATATLGCLMRVGGSSTDHPVLFVFVSDADDPQLVVKLPSLPVEVADVEREADLLSALNEVPALGVVVPTVADLRLTDDFAVMSQSFVPGVAASQAVNNQNYETIAGSVTAALTQLARATTEPRDEVWVRRLVDESLDRLGQTRETKMLELQRLTRISLEGLKLDTSVCQHRDLGPWNVHLSDTNQVGVIDWGDATMTGVPLCDVLHCLVHLGLILNDAYEATDRRAAVSNVLDPNTTSGVTITGCLHQYCEGLGIDGGQIRRLRILTWLRALVDRPPEQRVGSIYEELLLAELSAGQS